MALFERWRTTQAEPLDADAGASRPPASVASAAPASTATPADPGAAQLSIGPGLRLHLGEPLWAGSVKLDGALSGQLDLQHFSLGRSGHMAGSVRCHSAQLRGRFEGDLVVQGRLTVFASAQVTGRVRCNDVVVWKGAALGAEVRGLDGPASAAAVPAPQRRRGHLALLAPALAVEAPLPAR